MSPIWVHCYMLMLCLEIYCPIRWFGDTTQKLSNYCTSTCTSEPEAEPVTTSYMFSGSFSKQSSIYTHIYIYQKNTLTSMAGIAAFNIFHWQWCLGVGSMWSVPSAKGHFHRLQTINLRGVNSLSVSGECTWKKNPSPGGDCIPWVWPK